MFQKSHEGHYVQAWQFQTDMTYRYCNVMLLRSADRIHQNTNENMCVCLSILLHIHTLKQGENCYLPHTFRIIIRIHPIWRHSCLEMAPQHKAVYNGCHFNIKFGLKR